MAWWLAVPAGLAAVAALLSAAWWLAVLHVPADAIPTLAEVKAEHQASAVRLLDRRGRALAEVRTDFHGQRGDWVPVDRISPALRQAVLQAEDRRFETHGGVDWRAVAAAAWHGLRHGQWRGASTLSMQLAGLLDESLQPRRGARNWQQKLRQARQAQALEGRWRKAEILEAYLNLVPFRGELVGVDALSRIVFRKLPDGLDAQEGALAAALLRAPNQPVPRVAERACALLRLQDRAGQCAEVRLLAGRVLGRRSGGMADSMTLAPHAARILLAAHPAQGPALHSTLDASLQRLAVESTARHLRDLGAAQIQDAAVVVLENASGDILAYVGSSGLLSQAPHVDHARALRQAGSTLKPFLYAQALETRRLTLASLLHDSPLDLRAGDGLYVPQNYDRRHAGWVSARTALAASLNVPAVRVLTLMPVDDFASRLRDLGLPLRERGDFYGYSLALGSADVDLLSLSNAYRSLANLGVASETRLDVTAPVPRGRQVLSPAAAWLVGHALSDREARVRTFGLDSVLATPFWSAVKTGTSKDMRDNWCVGWSSRYTVGVWVGNSAGASMRDVSGVSGAGPIWQELMMYLHRDEPSAAPPPPPGVEAQDIVFEPALEPARREFFLAGTRMATVALAGAGEPGPWRVVAPADGTVLALDPDIPPPRQLLWLQAGDGTREAGPDVQWQHNGRWLGQGPELAWRPSAGRHRFTLTDAAGAVLDEVVLVVRAPAPVEPAGRGRAADGSGAADAAPPM